MKIRDLNGDFDSSYPVDISPIPSQEDLIAGPAGDKSVVEESFVRFPQASTFDMRIK
jgi:hypothetical protein